MHGNRYGSRSWTATSLTDRDGRQILNTLVPYGTPLPMSGAPQDLSRVFETRAPVLSRLFTGGVSKQPTIALGVPVVRGDAVVYSLNVGLSPSRIGNALGRRALPDGWVAAVLDSSGTIVARTRDAARFVGQKAVPTLAQAVQQESEGALETTTKEGTPVYTAFSRSALSGWTVAAGAPMTLLTTDLYRSIAWLALGTLFAFGLGLWLALRLANRLTSAVQGLVGPALALGEGRTVELPTTPVKEAQEVGTALLQASRMLAHAQHLAHYDPLTGLCNRVLFGELILRELAVAQRSGESFAILAIDLDGFKAVNDLHGHAAGDTVLKEAADRMARAIRVSDVAARLGGDEFAVLLMGVGQENAPGRRRGAGRGLIAALSGYPRGGVGQRGHRRLPAFRHHDAATAGACRCGAVQGQKGRASGGLRRICDAGCLPIIRGERLAAAPRRSALHLISGDTACRPGR